MLRVLFGDEELLRLYTYTSWMDTNFTSVTKFIWRSVMDEYLRTLRSDHHKKKMLSRQFKINASASMNRGLIRNICAVKPLVARPRIVVARAGLDWNTLNMEAYYIGKAVICFTMVYCGLNWAMYRRMRKDLEDDSHDSDKK